MLDDCEVVVVDELFFWLRYCSLMPAPEPSCCWCRCRRWCWCGAGDAGAGVDAAVALVAGLAGEDDLLSFWSLVVLFNACAKSPGLLFLLVRIVVWFFPA